MKAVARLAAAITLIVGASIAHSVDVAGAGEGASFTHAPSGFAFPSAVGRFERVSQNGFGPGGNDVGVGYNLTVPGSEMFVTLFVTRAPRLTGLAGDQLKQAENQVCADQFESRQDSERTNVGLP